jgi:two-component system chemotaxis response regulator CheB
MTNHSFHAVIIGASAGAVEALSVLLPVLSKTSPPVIVVVHLPSDKKSILADLFKMKCAISVKEAEDKEDIVGATVYFAPSDYHLLVEMNKRLSLSSEEPVLYSRPSIDVLFESAADAYKTKLLGILLTGGNNDGTQGMKTVLDNGGTAWIQDPQSAYASYMPESAIKICPDARIMTLIQMAEYLRKVALA